VCFRDIGEGSLFYIYCKNATKAIQLFTMTDSAWLGRKICVFEPDYEFQVAGVVAISTEQPLFPLVQQNLGTAVSTYIAEWATSSDIQSIYAPNVHDLIVQRITLVEACGSAMCDGQHEGTDEKCCALSCGTPPKMIPRATVSSARAGIRAKFQSISWSRFLIDEKSMKVRLQCMNMESVTI
jgi:hypothetical protein